MSPAYRQSSFRRFALISIASAALMAAPGFAQSSFNPNAFTSTILVSPAGSPELNGKALLNAVDGADATDQAPQLVWVEPGVYDLGDAVLQLMPYLSIQGSGVEVTIIQGNAQALAGFDPAKGLIRGADHSSLKGLTLRCVPDEEQGRGACVHMVNANASPEISDVKIESQGYGSHWGMRNINGSPRLENVEIAVHGTINNYGVVNSVGSYPVLRRVEIAAADGQVHNSGLFNREGGLPLVIDDTEIFAAGGQEAFAVYNFTPSAGGTLEIVDSLLIARDAQDNGAVRDGAIRIEAQGSTFKVDAPGSAVYLSQHGEIDVRDSELSGSEVLAFGRDVRLGSVRLQGAGLVAAADTLSCAAVFSLGNQAEFFENTCPAGADGIRSPRRARIQHHPWSEQAR